MIAVIFQKICYSLSKGFRKQINRNMSMAISIINEQQTTALATAVAKQIAVGEAVLLSGELGVGKTYFAKKFLNALGIAESLVASPTFTLVNVYDTNKGPLWHADLYRIKSKDEVLELGLEDAFSSSITLIEWPERADLHWPKDYLALSFEFSDDESARTITPQGFGTWGKKVNEVLNAVKRS